MTEKREDQETANALPEDILAAGNPHTGTFRHVTSTAKRLFADPEALKVLVILVSGSIFAFLTAADMGLLRAIDAWERNSGLSKYHVGEFTALLIALGVAIATFVHRRYREVREDPIGKTTSKKELKPAEIWAGFQYEQLATLFRQVETAKQEWQLTLDTIKDMVILTELDGTIQRCNRAFKEFVGLSYEEILRENIASLFANFGIGIDGLDIKALNARIHISGKWFGVRSYPYTDFETGTITRVVIIMLDVSAKKVTEEKVQFVWGNTMHPRPDRGKAPPSHPDFRLHVGDTPTIPRETPTRTIHQRTGTIQR